ncbi:hypothetical protein ECG_07350 [Echinococcus granulosus]|nr:hypothetical protein ECG_07350 [Echinococcus granulosus]
MQRRTSLLRSVHPCPAGSRKTAEVNGKNASNHKKRHLPPKPGERSLNVKRDEKLVCHRTSSSSRPPGNTKLVVGKKDAHLNHELRVSRAATMKSKCPRKTSQKLVSNPPTRKVSCSGGNTKKERAESKVYHEKIVHEARTEKVSVPKIPKILVTLVESESWRSSSSTTQRRVLHSHSGDSVETQAEAIDTDEVIDSGQTSDTLDSFECFTDSQNETTSSSDSDKFDRLQFKSQECKTGGEAERGSGTGQGHFPTLNATAAPDSLYYKIKSTSLGGRSQNQHPVGSLKIPHKSGFDLIPSSTKIGALAHSSQEEFSWIGWNSANWHYQNTQPLNRWGSAGGTVDGSANKDTSNKYPLKVGNKPISNRCNSLVHKESSRNKHVFISGATQPHILVDASGENDVTKVTYMNQTQSGEEDLSESGSRAIISQATYTQTSLTVKKEVEIGAGAECHQADREPSTVGSLSTLPPFTLPEHCTQLDCLVGDDGPNIVLSPSYEAPLAGILTTEGCQEKLSLSNEEVHLQRSEAFTPEMNENGCDEDESTICDDPILMLTNSEFVKVKNSTGIAPELVQREMREDAVTIEGQIPRKRMISIRTKNLTEKQKQQILLSLSWNPSRITESLDASLYATCLERKKLLSQPNDSKMPLSKKIIPPSSAYVKQWSLSEESVHTVVELNPTYMKAIETVISPNGELSNPDSKSMLHYSVAKRDIGHSSTVVSKTSKQIMNTRVIANVQSYGKNQHGAVDEVEINHSNSSRCGCNRSFTGVSHVQGPSSGRSDICGTWGQMCSDPGRMANSGGGCSSGGQNATKCPSSCPIKSVNDISKETDINKIAASCIRRYTLEESKALATSSPMYRPNPCSPTQKSCDNMKPTASCPGEQMSTTPKMPGKKVEGQAELSLKPLSSPKCRQNYPRMRQNESVTADSSDGQCRRGLQSSSMCRPTKPQNDKCMRNSTESFDDFKSFCNPGYSQPRPPTNMQRNPANRKSGRHSPCRIAITGCERPVLPSYCPPRISNPEIDSRDRFSRRRTDYGVCGDMSKSTSRFLNTGEDGECGGSSQRLTGGEKMNRDCCQQSSRYPISPSPKWNNTTAKDVSCDCLKGNRPQDSRNEDQELRYGDDSCQKNPGGYSFKIKYTEVEEADSPSTPDASDDDCLGKPNQLQVRDRNRHSPNECSCKSPCKTPSNSQHASCKYSVEDYSRDDDEVGYQGCENFDGDTGACPDDYYGNDSSVPPFLQDENFAEFSRSPHQPQQRYMEENRGCMHQMWSDMERSPNWHGNTKNSERARCMSRAHSEECPSPYPVCKKSCGIRRKRSRKRCVSRRQPTQKCSGRPRKVVKLSRRASMELERRYAAQVPRSESSLACEAARNKRRYSPPDSCREDAIVSGENKKCLCRSSSRCVMVNPCYRNNRAALLRRKFNAAKIEEEGDPCCCVMLFRSTPVQGNDFSPGQFSESCEEREGGAFNCCMNGEQVERDPCRKPKSPCSRSPIPLNGCQPRERDTEAKKNSCRSNTPCLNIDLKGKKIMLRKFENTTNCASSELTLPENMCGKNSANNDISIALGDKTIIIKNPDSNDQVCFESKYGQWAPDSCSQSGSSCVDSVVSRHMGCTKQHRQKSPCKRKCGSAAVRKRSTPLKTCSLRETSTCERSADRKVPVATTVPLVINPTEPPHRTRRLMEANGVAANHLVAQKVSFDSKPVNPPYESMGCGNYPRGANYPTGFSKMSERIMPPVPCQRAYSLEIAKMHNGPTEVNKLKSAVVPKGKDQVPKPWQGSEKASAIKVPEASLTPRVMNASPLRSSSNSFGFPSPHENAKIQSIKAVIQAPKMPKYTFARCQNDRLLPDSRFAVISPSLHHKASIMTNGYEANENTEVEPLTPMGQKKGEKIPLQYSFQVEGRRIHVKVDKEGVFHVQEVGKPPSPPPSVNVVKSGEKLRPNTNGVNGERSTSLGSSIKATDKAREIQSQPSSSAQLESESSGKSIGVNGTPNKCSISRSKNSPIHEILRRSIRSLSGKLTPRFSCQANQQMGNSHTVIEEEKMSGSDCEFWVPLTASEIPFQTDSKRITSKIFSTNSQLKMHNTSEESMIPCNQNDHQAILDHCRGTRRRTSTTSSQMLFRGVGTAVGSSYTDALPIVSSTKSHRSKKKKRVYANAESENVNKPVSYTHYSNYKSGDCVQKRGSWADERDCIVEDFDSYPKTKNSTLFTYDCQSDSETSIGISASMNMGKQLRLQAGYMDSAKPATPYHHFSLLGFSGGEEDSTRPHVEKQHAPIIRSNSAPLFLRKKTLSNHLFSNQGTPEPALSNSDTDNIMETPFNEDYCDLQEGTEAQAQADLTNRNNSAREEGRITTRKVSNRKIYSEEFLQQCSNFSNQNNYFKSHHEQVTHPQLTTLRSPRLLPPLNDSLVCGDVKKIVSVGSQLSNEKEKNVTMFPVEIDKDDTSLRNDGNSTESVKEKSSDSETEDPSPMSTTLTLLLEGLCGTGGGAMDSRVSTRSEPQRFNTKCKKRPCVNENVRCASKPTTNGQNKGEGKRVETSAHNCLKFKENKSFLLRKRQNCNHTSVRCMACLKKQQKQTLAKPEIHFFAKGILKHPFRKARRKDKRSPKDTIFKKSSKGSPRSETKKRRRGHLTKPSGDRCCCASLSRRWRSSSRHKTRSHASSCCNRMASFGIDTDGYGPNTSTECYTFQLVEPSVSIEQPSPDFSRCKYDPLMHQSRLFRQCSDVSVAPRSASLSQYSRKHFVSASSPKSRSVSMPTAEENEDDGEVENSTKFGKPNFIFPPPYNTSHAPGKLSLNSSSKTGECQSLMGDCMANRQSSCLKMKTALPIWDVKASTPPLLMVPSSRSQSDESSFVSSPITSLNTSEAEV